jgi:hypothetical protein
VTGVLVLRCRMIEFLEVGKAFGGSTTAPVKFGFHVFGVGIGFAVVAKFENLVRRHKRERVENIPRV